MTRLNFSGFNTKNWPYVHIGMSEAPGAEYTHRVVLRADKPIYMIGDEIADYIKQTCRGKVYVVRLLDENPDLGALPGSSGNKFPTVGIYFTKNSDVLLFKLAFSDYMKTIDTGAFKVVKPWYAVAARRRVDRRNKSV